MRNRKGGSVTGKEKHAEPRHLLLAREPVQIIYIYNLILYIYIIIYIYIYIYNKSWIFVYESLRQIKVAIDQKAFESNRNDSLAVIGSNNTFST